MIYFIYDGTEGILWEGSRDYITFWLPGSEEFIENGFDRYVSKNAFEDNELDLKIIKEIFNFEFHKKFNTYKDFWEWFMSEYGLEAL